MRLTHEAFTEQSKKYGDDQVAFLCWERDLILTKKHPDAKARLGDDHIQATKVKIEGFFQSMQREYGEPF